MRTQSLAAASRFQFSRPAGFAILLALATAPPSNAPAQQQPAPQFNNQPITTSRPLVPGSGQQPQSETGVMMHHMAEEQAKSRNSLRQQQLVNQTAKLLELATDLKAEVDKSNKDTLSLTVVKKAEEIEKLAKQVKEKMRDAQ